ncbi:electron transport complex subunit RsxC [Aquimonas voraii]|uniref:Ion-translocating oxidoreductase complex subunit C n=1 Tax=Aquimonas voraii TaxID=265719 RepID=A0A1G6SLW1_9GAMM|nr:electron transport complex subunit RsxC [Aquimonas voraii]SDD17828.1 electron transport complex protein RnfC [Aquimonas voraii]
MAQLYRFHGGLPLDGRKGRLPIEPIRTAPLPARLCLPLRMHARGRLAPCVVAGQRVHRFEVLARPEDSGGACLNAPTAGVIEAIEPRGLPHAPGDIDLALVLRVDADSPFDALPFAPIEDWPERGPAELRARLVEAGVAGLGGAVFPTADKLMQACDTLILNGAECEPYIACDERLLAERAEEVLRGGLLLRHVLGAQRVLVAIEDSMAPAREALMAALTRINVDTLQLVEVPTRYPQGGERQLIEVLTGREVPIGGLPQDLGIVVHNVGTAAAAWRAVVHGEALVERIVSVTGPGVVEPANWRVALGTSIADLVAASGGYTERAQRLVMGGGMMGVSLPDDGFPIVKASTCVLVLDSASARPVEAALPCIRCGDCAEVCPPRLLPQLLHESLRSEDIEDAAQLGLEACIECGLCDLACPSHIPLVQGFRSGKTRLKLARRKAIDAHQARARYEARAVRLEREKQELAARRAEAGKQAASRAAIAAAIAKAKARSAGKSAESAREDEAP